MARLALARLVLGEVLRLLGDRVEARLLLAAPRRAPRLPVMVVVVVAVLVVVVGLFVGSVAGMNGRESLKGFRRPGYVPLATSDTTKGGRPKKHLEILSKKSDLIKRRTQ